MSKQIIHTDAAPAAVGPYCKRSPSAAARRSICPARSAWSPAPAIWCPRTSTPRVRQAFANMQEVIKAAGGTLDNVVDPVPDRPGQVRGRQRHHGRDHFSAFSGALHHRRGQPPKGAQFEVEAILVL